MFNWQGNHGNHNNCHFRCLFTLCDFVFPCGCRCLDAKLNPKIVMRHYTVQCVAHTPFSALLIHRSVRQHRIHRLAFWESNIHQWCKLESGVISFPQIEEVRKCPMATVGLSSNWGKAIEDGQGRDATITGGRIGKPPSQVETLHWLGWLNAPQVQFMDS